MSTNRKTFRMPTALALAAALPLVLAACGGEAHDHALDHAHDAEQQLQELQQRHAIEMQELAGQVNTHLAAFRQLSAAAAQQHIGEHARIVAQLNSQMSRHMRDIASATAAAGAHAEHDHARDDHAVHDHAVHDHAAQDHGAHGEADHHGQMMQLLQALRTEAEELQTASQGALAERLPAQLDRLGIYAELLLAHAEHMRQH